MLEGRGETPAPDEVAVDREPRPVAELEDVEVAPLRPESLQGLALQDGLQVAVQDGPLPDGENPELGQAPSAEGDRVAAEEAGVGGASPVVVDPEPAIGPGRQA